jgi:hypothetical protein
MFVFEGNGVVINLRAVASNKDRYPRILCYAIITIMAWYMTLSLLSYSTFSV